MKGVLIGESPKQTPWSWGGPLKLSLLYVTKALFDPVLNCFVFSLASLIPSCRGLSCILEAIGNVLLQRCKVSMTKHRKQNTKVRAKEIDLIWT